MNLSTSFLRICQSIEAPLPNSRMRYTTVSTKVLLQGACLGHLNTPLPRTLSRAKSRIVQCLHRGDLAVPCIKNFQTLVNCSASGRLVWHMFPIIMANDSIVCANNKVGSCKHMMFLILC